MGASDHLLVSYGGSRMGFAKYSFTKHGKGRWMEYGRIVYPKAWMPKPPAFEG